MIVNSVTVVPIILAVGLDLAFGDPPNRYHPVAWMGSALTVARHRLPKRGKLLPFFCGALLMGAGVAVAVAIGAGIDQGLLLVPLPLALVVEAIVLKSLFSIKGLAVAARAVASALNRGELARRGRWRRGTWSGERPMTWMPPASRRRPSSRSPKTRAMASWRHCSITAWAGSLERSSTA